MTCDYGDFFCSDQCLSVPIGGNFFNSRFSPCLRASVVDFCLRAIRTFNATLREIFDESAYDRFLQRTGTSHCKDSYRAFMRDRESAMAQKPRCC